MVKIKEIIPIDDAPAIKIEEIEARKDAKTNRDFSLNRRENFPNKADAIADVPP